MHRFAFRRKEENEINGVTNEANLSHHIAAKQKGSTLFRFEKIIMRMPFVIGSCTDCKRDLNRRHKTVPTRDFGATIAVHSIIGALRTGESYSINIKHHPYNTYILKLDTAPPVRNFHNLRKLLRPPHLFLSKMLCCP